MVAIELYSKRQRKLTESGKADVYRYDVMPGPLRVQICHIWRDALGISDDQFTSNVWENIHKTLAKEKGVFALGGRYDNDRASCEKWFLEADFEDAIDAVEVVFRCIKIFAARLDDYGRRSAGISQRPDDAIRELNVRFRDHAVGYQFADGWIVRTDSEYVHAEVVQPALALLREARFRVAQEDFLTAHKHYRQGQEKGCIVACQRAFESLLKAICAARKWDFEQGSTASELIKLVRQRGLFPDYLGAGFDTFVAMLRTGLPGVRNNAGAHGAAPDALAVPSYIAGYALHMTATNILFLAEAFRDTSC